MFIRKRLHKLEFYTKKTATIIPTAAALYCSSILHHHRYQGNYAVPHPVYIR